MPPRSPDTGSPAADVGAAVVSRVVERTLVITLNRPHVKNAIDS